MTLLALGNGAPDVFASLAAFTGATGPDGAGEVGTGMIGAIVSAGMFVSGGVVGAVAIVAAPFMVEPGPFLRDLGFYLAVREESGRGWGGGVTVSRLETRRY